MLATLKLKTASVLFTLLTLFSASCFGVISPLRQQTVTVCDATIQPDWPVNFSLATCQHLALAEVDPQNKTLWLKLNLAVTQQQLAQLKPPLALYLNAKASSSVYLNGHHLGNNGLPGNQQDEIAGDMDARFYVPAEVLQPGDNQLIIKMSAWQSLLTLPHPLHFIGISHYESPQHYLQRYSSWMLVILGIVFIASLYFAIRSLQPIQRSRHMLLAFMSLFAALQLFSEISRALFSYSYPLHDVRLLAINISSFAFGLCLLIFMARRFAKRHALHWIYTGASATLITIMLIPGFDSKTTAATFCPMLISALLTCQNGYRSTDRNAIAAAIALSIFLLIMVFSADYFHENLYFVLITLLLGYLFVQQTLDYNIQLDQHQQDKERIAKLTLRLAQDIQHDKPATLKINSAGKVDIVNTANITFCQAAGDYSEINLLDGRQHLYSGTLKSLEAELPSTFLRVHRSYLVNLEQVTRLQTSTTKSSGSVTSLLLQNSLQIPVSRRLIPVVRSAVSS
ncbi:MAG: LytTR family transcriptional regulator [Gammaproteobacteria bacterium]|nr:LytTR family transcriptional regulator [Gammaproteobacteria bacterium]MBU1555850.1 LytTR family transcriptional regulator [Gammaproteobacteria bacterium]MBU2069057.1 LytTR family transcriptional regulator [Gammaproteobacteria bacterium]MBU2182688.1 LytTR family transcriptional regulator [Gammaproteobacteria bacterium]MBU2206714.1 LytTR family transcriptional regulator [Gammaproteobacteria bacterium]